MSQVEVCSRCHQRPANVVCTICAGMGDNVKLCSGCFSPHYRLMHNYDPNTGEKLKPEKDPRIPFKFEEKFTVIVSTPAPKNVIILNTPKGKGKLRKAVDRQIMQEWIKKNLP